MKTKVLIVFASLIAIISLQLSIDKDTKEESITKAMPLFSMKNFIQSKSDTDGNIKYKLTAKIMNIINKNEANIVSPQIILNPYSPKTRWKLKANKGKMNGDNILLTGKISAKSTSTGKQFTSKQLNLNQKTRVAISDEKVTLKNGMMSTQGVGFSFNANTNEIKLFSETFTTYETNKIFD